MLPAHRAQAVTVVPLALLTWLLAATAVALSGCGGGADDPIVGSDDGPGSDPIIHLRAALQVENADGDAFGGVAVRIEGQLAVPGFTQPYYVALNIGEGFPARFHGKQANWVGGFYDVPRPAAGHSKEIQIRVIPPGYPDAGVSFDVPSDAPDTLYAWGNIHAAGDPGDDTFFSQITPAGTRTTRVSGVVLAPGPAPPPGTKTIPLPTR